MPVLLLNFQNSYAGLGREFDGEIAGINLAETSIHFDENNLPEDFKCDGYFDAVTDTMRSLKKSFRKSLAVQYVNFYPCEWNNDKRYMQKTFELAETIQLGLGNPDTVPYRKGQMANSYPFFNRFNNRITTAIAVQEPDYTYINKKTGKSFTAKELYNFSVNYLGSDIIFWNLQEPQFSMQVIPLLKTL